MHASPVGWVVVCLFDLRGFKGDLVMILVLVLVSLLQTGLGLGSDFDSGFLSPGGEKKANQN